MATLLLTTTGDPSGEGALRYVSLGAARKVLATGTTRVTELPPGEARLSFYARTAFFSQVETDKRAPKLLPIYVRRLIDGELAFNEPFRARYCAKPAQGEGRQNLALAAVAEADYTLLAGKFPLPVRPFGCIAPAECALAALLGKVTAEPVRVLWRRGVDMLGLLVENGEVRARQSARVENEAAVDEATFADRVLPLLAKALNTDAGVGREVVVTLALGEWGSLPDGMDAKIGAGVCRQMQALFPGAAEGDVVAWPELYGLPFVIDDFNFVSADYMAQVQGVRMAKPAVWIAGLATAAFGIFATFNAIQASTVGSDVASRRATLASNLQAVESEIPKPEDIEKLKRRLGVQSSLEGIRLDRFLAWVSRNTPKNVVIRKLEVGRDGAGATQAAPGAAPGTGTTPAQSWKATIEYEVPGGYEAVEKMSAEIIASLGSKGKLTSSALNVDNTKPTRLNVTLVTQETTFSE